MNDTLENIPPEAWPLIELMFRISVSISVIWLLLTVFVWWRRSASNLTPVNATSPNKSAQPDFLSVDEKARAKALKRGEEFDTAQREKEEAIRRGKPAPRKKNLVQQLAGLISFLMSVFTIATMIFGAIWQVSRMGVLMKEYSSLERLAAVIGNHPISFTVIVLVIVIQIYSFVSTRTAKEH